MPANAELAFSLEVSRRMLHMFVDDLTPQERLHRACAGANCIDWTVGHLVLTERMFHTRLGVTSPPIPEGLEPKFARTEEAVKQADYGDTSGLMALFDEQRNATLEAVKSMTPEQLSQPLEKPHPRFSTMGEAAAFCSLHVTMHAGQMSIIRRTLGKPPVI
jgi:uncharacterized damage-inducible protein DinB